MNRCRIQPSKFIKTYVVQHHACETMKKNVSRETVNINLYISHFKLKEKSVTK